MNEQAERVDEDARDAVAKAIADVIGHGMREKCYAHADAVLAALAQNTQGDGEAVLEIGECAEVIWNQGGPCQLPPGAKLYLHAERARVPDAFLVHVVKDGEAWEHKWYVPRWGDPDPTTMDGKPYSINGVEHPEMGCYRVQAFAAIAAARGRWNRE